MTLVTDDDPPHEVWILLVLLMEILKLLHDDASAWESGNRKWTRTSGENNDLNLGANKEQVV